MTSSTELQMNLQQILAGVYSPAQLKELLPQLIKLADNFETPANPKGWVSQKDAMLITYGDSIKDGEQAPLQTLHEFLNKNVDSALSAVHILPFYPYTSDDGFSVTDYWKVNPELGNWQDVQSLSSDFDMMFDGVINHLSAKSDWFQGYLKGDEQFRDFFVEANPDRDYSSVTRPRALPLLTRFDTAHGEKYIWTTFSEDQIDLNFKSPEVFTKIVELMLFYAEQGATYVRLDAIGFMWKELDTPCIHQPQTHAIVQAIRAVLDSVAPQLKLITETNVPHADNVSYFGNGENEAHLVYQFPLPPLTLHTLHSGNSDVMTDWLSNLEPCTEQTTFFNFLASHDGIGVRPVEGLLSTERVAEIAEIVKNNGGRVSYKNNGDGTQSPYELNINYFDALRHTGDDEETAINRFIAAQTILLSNAGVPGIYVHSLLGSTNDYEGLETLGYNRAINREKLDRNTVEAELNNPEHRRNKVFNRFKELLHLRSEEEAFRPAASQRVEKVDSRLITLVRDEKVLVAVNISNESVELNAEQILPGVSLDLISNKVIGQKPVLKPYQALWLKAE